MATAAVSPAIFHLLKFLATAAVAFSAANIGELMVLLLYFSDRRFRSWQIITGSYLGVAAVIALCLAGAAAASYIPSAVFRALGIVPIAVGVHRLIARSKDQSTRQMPWRGSAWTQILTVAGITFADCGDNLAIFTPLYARCTGFERTAITLLFLIMVAVWCAAARHLARNPHFEKRVRLLGDALAPWALMGLGLYIILG